MRSDTKDRSMEGKVVVITGGTSGIGEVAAMELAEMGARIVLVARDAQRARNTLRRLAGAGPPSLLHPVQHQTFLADVSEIEQVKRVARDIAAEAPRIDVLINNAGSMFAERQVTVDGFERTFATNHMAYFVLTDGLMECLLAAGHTDGSVDQPGARVVNTASDVHRGAALDIGDLQSQKRYSAFSVYGKSKLCNVLFTRELARRLKGTGVTANCLHPGVVATRFGSDSGDASIQTFVHNSGIKPEEGAKTIVYLATSGEVAKVSGRYFYQCKVTAPSKEAQDDAVAKRLWTESGRMAGIEED
jgi:NAD(P)-dependent dehydrogenase (short-subunit alcohol dehydrogenase family)